MLTEPLKHSAEAVPAGSGGRAGAGSRLINWRTALFPRATQRIATPCGGAPIPHSSANDRQGLH
jgi:hypothetical protein